MKKKYHRSIVIGESVYHIGGDTSWFGTRKYVEKWTMKNSKFKKETKKLIDEDGLDEYGDLYYPEIFIVPADYCNFGKSEKL